MASLRQKTLTGLSWSSIDSIVNQTTQLVVGIILARLLSPREFGLIGMLAVFVAVSQGFIDSGFNQALIRKNTCTEDDYSTVFYFNLAVGVSCYLILFFSAGLISGYFREPQLFALVRVLGITLIVNSLGLIQWTILIKEINFKLQAKVSIIASGVSGVIGVGMAYHGWGVWSLVWRTVSQSLIVAGLLWLWNGWRPIFVFRFKSFREMFNFGSKLLASGLIDTIARNVYYLVIGKYFSATDLGYYTRADDFRNKPSAYLTDVVGRVAFPVLAQIKSGETLKASYKKLIKCTMFICLLIMVGMAAVARPMVVTLVGEKWMPSVPYLRLLCFAGMLYPLQALNLDMLKVRGRSDLVLKLEIVKKALIVPTVLIGVFLGIEMMIVGIVAISFIAYFFNSYWSGMMVNYPMKEQIADVMPSFIITLAMGAVVSAVGYLLPLKPVALLSVQVAVGASFALGVARLLRLDAYMEMEEIVLERLYRRSRT